MIVMSCSKLVGVCALFSDPFVGVLDGLVLCCGCCSLSRCASTVFVHCGDDLLFLREICFPLSFFCVGVGNDFHGQL